MSGRPAWLRPRLLLAAALTVLLPWLLIRHLAVREDFVATLQRLTPGSLALPVVLSAVALLLAAARWRVVVRSLGYSMSTRRVLFVVLATWPASAIVPSRLADGLRAVMVRREVPLGRGLGGVLIEKALDLQSLGWVFLAGCLAMRWIGAAALTGLFLALFWYAFLVGPGVLLTLSARFPAKLRDGVQAAVASADALRRKPWLLLELWLLSLAGWALTLAIMLALLRATSAEVATADVILIWPATVVAGVLPITLTGLGTRDSAFLGLLSLLGRSVDTEPILAATLLYPVVTAWLYVVVGAPFALWALAGQRGSADDHLIDKEEIEHSQSAEKAVEEPTES